MFSKPEYKVIKIGMKYVVVNSAYSSRNPFLIHDLSNFYYSYFKSKSEQVCYLLNRAAKNAWMVARFDIHNKSIVEIDQTVVE